MPAKIAPPPRRKGEPLYTLAGLTFWQVEAILEKMRQIECARWRAKLIRAGHIKPAKEMTV